LILAKIAGVLGPDEVEELRRKLSKAAGEEVDPSVCSTSTSGSQTVGSAQSSPTSKTSSVHYEDLQDKLKQVDELIQRLTGLMVSAPPQQQPQLTLPPLELMCAHGALPMREHTFIASSPFRAPPRQYPAYGKRTVRYAGRNRVVQTGPRGGKYVNKGGRKVYLSSM